MIILVRAVLVILTVLYIAPLSADQDFFENLPVNRWVPIDTTCVGGLKSYAGGCPSSRGWLQLAYDSQRGKVVLFGGSGEWYFNDLWYLDPLKQQWRLVLQDTRLAHEEKNWQTYPKGRDNHQLVYDEINDIYWMYGGTGGGGFWKYIPSKTQWHRMPGWHNDENFPMAKLDPGFTYSADRKEILLFGGEHHTFHNETWRFDIMEEKWQKLPTRTAPEPRAQIENALVYDTARQQYILFGGRSLHKKPYGDTWIFEPNEMKWIQMHPENTPSARDQHILVFDQNNGVVIMLGGGDTADTWIYDPEGNIWNEIASARGDYEQGRARLASAVYMPELDITVFRDVKGKVYYFRLDLNHNYKRASDNDVQWHPG